MEFGEMKTKHVELEQFLHAFASRGFVSVSWAFLVCVCSVTCRGGRASECRSWHSTERLAAVPGPR